MPASKKSGSSRSRTKSPGKRSKSPTMSASMLLGGSPTSKSGGSAASRKRVVCGTKNGKLMCSTVDAKDVAMSEYGKKHVERKRKECENQAKFGLGVCDADGDMHYFEDETPTIHEEIDANGNIIRFMVLETKKILELSKEEENVIAEIKDYLRDNSIDKDETKDPLNNFKKAVEKLVNAEMHNTNPDKLKQAYFSTPDEIKRKNTFRRYLACLANDDTMPYDVANGFSSTLGINLQAFSKVMLTNGLIQRIVELIRKEKSDPDAEKRRAAAREEQRLQIASSKGLFVLPLEEGMYFRRAIWEYSPTESVTVKLPEPLSVALAEKLSLNELRHALNDESTTAADARKWIRLLIANGSLVGTELSSSIVAMLLLDVGLTPSEIGMEDSVCGGILTAETRRRSLIANSHSEAPKIRLFAGSGRGLNLKKDELFKRVEKAATAAATAAGASTTEASLVGTAVAVATLKADDDGVTPAVADTRATVAGRAAARDAGVDVATADAAVDAAVEAAARAARAEADKSAGFPII